MLLYMQYVMAVKGMGRNLSDERVLLYKTNLVGLWVKRREVVDRIRIRSEKLMENQCRGYTRTIQKMRLE